MAILDRVLSRPRSNKWVDEIKTKQPPNSAHILLLPLNRYPGKCNSHLILSALCDIYSENSHIRESFSRFSARKYRKLLSSDPIKLRILCQKLVGFYNYNNHRSGDKYLGTQLGKEIDDKQKPNILLNSRDEMILSVVSKCFSVRLRSMVPLTLVWSGNDYNLYEFRKLRCLDQTIQFRQCHLSSSILLSVKGLCLG